MYIIKLLHVDEPTTNEKFLQQLVGQQHEIIKLLSVMAQPTTTPVLANAVSKQTNNTPLPVPLAITAQASQQMTLKTLLSDNFNATTCTTNDNLIF